MAKKDILARLRKIYEGGAGSGNFGHAGRPGEQGGSGEGEGGTVVFDIGSIERISSVAVGKMSDKELATTFNATSKVVDILRKKTDSKDANYITAKGNLEFLYKEIQDRQKRGEDDTMIHKFGTFWRVPAGKKENLIARLREGGAGSGNFGHAGRPGELGGSGEGGSRDIGGGTGDTSGKLGAGRTAGELAKKKGGDKEVNPEDTPQGKWFMVDDHSTTVAVVDWRADPAEVGDNAKTQFKQLGIKMSIPKGADDYDSYTYTLSGKHLATGKVVKTGGMIDRTSSANDALDGIEANAKKFGIALDYGPNSEDSGDSHVWAMEPIKGKRKGESIITRMRKIYEGGAGSGNFGHAGRPGELGGSGEGGSRDIGGGTGDTSGKLGAGRTAGELAKKAKGLGNMRKNLATWRGALKKTHPDYKAQRANFTKRIGRIDRSMSSDHLKAAQPSTRFGRSITKGINQGELGTNALIPGSGWKRGLRSENILARLRAMSEGGAGSGNFGHSGIPGHTGGSGGGGGSVGRRQAREDAISKEKSAEMKATVRSHERSSQARTNASNRAAMKAGWDPNKPYDVSYAFKTKKQYYNPMADLRRRNAVG